MSSVIRNRKRNRCQPNNNDRVLYYIYIECTATENKKNDDEYWCSKLETNRNDRNPKILHKAQTISTIQSLPAQMNSKKKSRNEMKKFSKRQYCDNFSLLNEFRNTWLRLKNVGEWCWWWLWWCIDALYCCMVDVNWAPRPFRVICR